MKEVENKEITKKQPNKKHINGTTDDIKQLTKELRQLIKDVKTEMKTNKQIQEYLHLPWWKRIFYKF